MQVREKQRSVEVAVPSTTERRRTSPRRPSTGAWAVTAAIVSVILVVTMVVMSRGGSTARSARQPSVVSTASQPVVGGVEATRLERAVRWIDGLAAGLISPPEVNSRLAGQDPELARVVDAAWSDLGSTPASDVRRAVKWIDGLAAGLILPREVSSRLARQDPELAKVVETTWSHLNPVADRGAGW
jgi:hypothetical protein